MEAMKRERTQLRRLFSKALGVLDEKLSDAEATKADVSTNFKIFEDRAERLFALDRKIEEQCYLSETEINDEILTKEYDETESYREKYFYVKGKYDDKLQEEIMEGKSTISDNSDRQNSNKNIKLPKLELKRFDGNLKNWIGFWGQFKRIHEDNLIEPEDKFQYLYQATVPGTSARELVESFPPSADNYPKAIELLKSRFAKEELLIDIYVRELLQLVLQRNCANNEMSLRSLYDKLKTQLRALESLGVTTNKYAAILYPLVESAIPNDVLKAWERLRAMQELDKSNQSNYLEALLTFLGQEVEQEERLSIARSSFHGNSNFESNEHRKQLKGHFNSKSHKSENIGYGKNTVPTAAALVDVGPNKSNCVFCNGSHQSTTCFKAQKMDINEKKDTLRKKGYCFSCLTAGHVSSMCKAFVKCKKCSKKHATVMCSEKRELQTNTYDREKKDLDTDHSLANNSCTEEVLMQTLMIRFRGNDKEIVARALVDTGSQRSYISRATAEELGYVSMSAEKMKHSLFGGVEASQIHQRYRVYLSSLNKDYMCNFEVYDQETICSDIPKINDGPWTKELDSLKIILSDGKSTDCCVEKDTSSKIQLLIGADIAGKLFTGNLKLLTCGVTAMETRLGWTLMGKIPNSKNRNSSLLVLSLHVNEAKISDLWTLDSLGILDPAEKLAKENLQQQAVEHFNQTVRQNADGRYEVSLPWIAGHPELSDNKSVAEIRLKSTVKSLQSSGNLEAYESVFKNWLEENIIEKVPESEINNFGHYLPHRAVIRLNSTTKIRPVFDGSSKQRGHPSLNNFLEKGPNLIETIPSVINRFRNGNIGVISDIRKAFLQIELNKRDRDFLRFLWWEQGNPENAVIYRHQRVVFGVSSSPFLLEATLAHHLSNAPDNLQETAEKLMESWYVDNCVTSVENEHELNKFISESRELMSMARFDLRGWQFTNTSSALSMSTNKQPYATEINTDNVESVLGLRWNLDTDTLICDTRELQSSVDEMITKRHILAVAHKIFDPIGFTAPFTLIPKLLQECWKIKSSWDTELPESIVTKFKKWRGQLNVLDGIEIPRKIKDANCLTGGLSLHVFCDASKMAYATCIFLRSENEEKVSCQLIQTKTRVAPLKEVSIPRLELLAACIGARLADSVKRDLHMEQLPIFYWSDSTNALYWIKNEEIWCPFVMNRVTEIRSLSKREEWYYIPGIQNPADLPSRGSSVEKLIQTRWWEGPQWLKLPPESWPKCGYFPNPEIINAERKKTVVSASNMIQEAERGATCPFPAEMNKSDWYYSYTNKYDLILRVLAWVQRFCNNCKCVPGKRSGGGLTCKEIMQAEKQVLRLVQRESFNGIEDKKLASLCPFVDQEGIIRLKTKITERKDLEDSKTPAVLPSKHRMIKILVLSTHLRSCHVGVQGLLSILREKFWILKSRKTVRNILTTCTACKRHETKPVTVSTPALPEPRVREAAIFETTGIDFAGPLFLKNGKKVWICLFTCAVYRAVHLEMTMSLSTESFIQAFRRFVARRGRPIIVYSDNGTNFIGTDNVFSHLNWDKISRYSSIEQIDWRFNPPTAAWWGGWWERLIRILKQLLRKTLGKASLTFEELQTILCDCESVMNSRPLTYVSEDGSDLEPITPNMFLIDIKEVGVPECDVIDSEKLNKRAKYRQKLRDSLRIRFRVEYLGQLKLAAKKGGKHLLVGEVVLLETDNKKRVDWPLACVKELIPGKDGEVRLVRVKTTSGVLFRPVQRIYPLEINAQGIEDSSIIPVKDPLTESKVEESEKEKDDHDQDIVHERRTRSGRKIVIPHRFWT